MKNDIIQFSEKNIVCDECSAEFLVQSVKIDECLVEIDSSILLLRYVMCPMCHHIYKILLVDEQKYCEMADDLISIEKRIKKMCGKGNVFLMERLRKMAINKKNKIQKYVNMMNAKYSGTFTIDTSKNNKNGIVYSPRL